MLFSSLTTDRITWGDRFSWFDELWFRATGGGWSTTGGEWWEKHVRTRHRHGQSKRQALLQDTYRWHFTGIACATIFEFYQAAWGESARDQTDDRRAVRWWTMRILLFERCWTSVRSGGLSGEKTVNKRESRLAFANCTFGLLALEGSKASAVCTSRTGNDLAAWRTAITNSGQTMMLTLLDLKRWANRRRSTRSVAIGLRTTESGELSSRRWILATHWSVLQFKLHNSFFCFLNEHKTRYNVRILLFLFFQNTTPLYNALKSENWACALLSLKNDFQPLQAALAADSNELFAVWSLIDALNIWKKLPLNAERSRLDGGDQQVANGALYFWFGSVAGKLKGSGSAPDLASEQIALKEL